MKCKCGAKMRKRDEDRDGNIWECPECGLIYHDGEWYDVIEDER